MVFGVTTHKLIGKIENIKRSTNLDELNLLYSDKDLKKAIAESRKILKSYRALKVVKRLKFPYIKSPANDSRQNPSDDQVGQEISEYTAIVNRIAQIEKCVSCCELTQREILSKKFLDNTEYIQPQLALLSGYSSSRYNDYLRSGYIQFLVAYKTTDSNANF